jgi:hypothetical protein
MQLKNIKGRIGLATCTLLQAAAPTVQAEFTDIDIDTAVLYYSEEDGRVSAFEPAIHVGANLNDTHRLDFRLVYDVLTGATPNGAYKTTTAQTFTTPSGKKSYTTKAGKTPLDSTFHDTRTAGAVDWTIAVDRVSNLILGANMSTEYDYFSAGLTSTYTHDFNKRNTTLTAGASFNYDEIKPEGDIPMKLAPMVKEDTALNRKGSSDDKVLGDIILGLTQVVNRNMIMQINYTLGITDGYQNDPYKIVTVVDPATGLPAAGAGTIFDPNGDNLPYLHERRPNSRLRNALFFQTKYHLTEDVVDLSYRFYWDDWGISSNTVEAKYRYQMGRSYLQPNIRYYLQDEADFYRHNLVLGADVDASTGAVSKKHASNDYRLAKLVTSTYGLKYGYLFKTNAEFSLRGEYISQNVDNGNITAGEGTPDMNAIVVQANFSIFW